MDLLRRPHCDAHAHRDMDFTRRPVAPRTWSVGSRLRDGKPGRKGAEGRRSAPYLAFAGPDLDFRSVKAGKTQVEAERSRAGA